MLKNVVVVAALLATIACSHRVAFADDAKTDAAMTGLERYAPSQHQTAPKDIDATSETNTTLPDLEATRAAIDRQTGSNIQLNVSGWVSQQVQINR